MHPICLFYILLSVIISQTKVSLESKAKTKRLRLGSVREMVTLLKCPVVAVDCTFNIVLVKFLII